MDAPTAAKRRRTAAEEVSDAEVEEFYAILRRMRDASRRLVPGAGAGVPARAPAWCPSFSWEDFAPPGTATSQQQRPPVAGNATPPRRPAGVSLDLNVEPEPEAPATPRPERVTA